MWCVRCTIPFSGADGTRRPGLPEHPAPHVRPTAEDRDRPTAVVHGLPWAAARGPAHRDRPGPIAGPAAVRGPARPGPAGPVVPVAAAGSAAAASAAVPAAAPEAEALAAAVSAAASVGKHSKNTRPDGRVFLRCGDFDWGCLLRRADGSYRTWVMNCSRPCRSRDEAAGPSPASIWAVNWASRSRQRSMPVSWIYS